MSVFKKSSRKAGLPPGTLVHIGEMPTEDVKITLMDYDEGHVEEKRIYPWKPVALLKPVPR